MLTLAPIDDSFEAEARATVCLLFNEIDTFSNLFLLLVVFN